MSEPESSLIQQRMALDRKRAGSVYGVVMPLIAMGTAVVLIVVGELPWLYTVSALVFAASAVVSGVRLREARREMQEFEEQYGADAGKQD
jgi:hypothetical protein